MATKPISPGQSYEYRFHGTDTRGLYDTAEGPAWNSHAGRFGRMFHSVPVFVKDPEALRELADGMQDEGERDNPEIPAGFTYLGQFVDHDITFDTASSLQR